MKKKILILAGILALGLTFSGCEKKDAVETAPEVTVTVAPTAESVQPEPVTENRNLVEMQKTDPSEREKNVIGNKSESAAKMTITNKTDGEVAEIYIRKNTDDDDEWGEELIQTAFTLKDGETAIYYFEKGDVTDLYDVRIGYTQEGKNECFFRKLPLNSITEITLCMDGEGEDSIPFARYKTGENSEEVSTLNDVLRRLGLLDDEDEDEDYEERQEEKEEDDTPSVSDPDPEPEVEDDPVINPGAVNEEKTAAENCIGRPLSALISACGEPNGTTYENEPETGETGYHYYNGFTVSTTVDANGNETVAGVW